MCGGGDVLWDVAWASFYPSYSLHLEHTGVSVLKSLSSVGTCMKQLSFSDAPRVEDCYLYKLAHKSVLQDFKVSKICLCL